MPTDPVDESESEKSLSDGVTEIPCNDDRRKQHKGA